MMKKISKWILIVLGSLVLIVLLLYTVVYFKTQSRINKEYQVSLQQLTIPDDSASYARGKHIAINRGCTGCHGADLSGGYPFADEKSPIGILYSSNITPGKGGIQYKDEDWIRIVRHGLNQQNKSAWFMPSQDMYMMSNQDLKDLISYLKKQPGVDHVIPAHSLKPLGRFLLFTDKFPLLPAEMINQTAVFPDSVQATVSAGYGAYLATTCQGCHGKDMKGAPAHGPGEEPTPDISSTGNVGKWSSADLIHLFRTGSKPDGKQVSPAMPWKDFSYTDDELTAISLYLHSIK